MSKTRGVRGAAGWCAIAAILYFIMVYPLSKLVSYVERRMNASER